MHSVYNIKVLLEHSNSRTFKGLPRVWNFFPKFKDFQGLLKDAMNPDTYTQTIEIY